MPVNRDKPDRWKADIAKSVDLYNAWFMRFAPKAFRDTRLRTTVNVAQTLGWTGGLTRIDPAMLRAHPSIIATLRMSTCPPIAVDRLIGLSRVSNNLVDCMEQGKLPAKMPASNMDADLRRIGETIRQMADPDIFVWLGRAKPATLDEINRAATIVADRLCGAVANPIIRNAQETRQLDEITAWLQRRGYRRAASGTRLDELKAGTFAFRLNVPVALETGKRVNIPVDAVILPRRAGKGDLPLLIEAKSAGDFTNVNKRRKEEATKMVQLRRAYGSGVRYVLFLCGYFDSGYLGYEAAEGIDWVWEHRIDDLAELGL